MEDNEPTESTETTQEGDAFRVTEEIVQEEPEERTVIREERYVNEDGKTVIRRVYKKRGKKKVRRKKKKAPKKDLDIGGGEIKTNVLGGFGGIVEEDDGTPELQRFKFRKREDRDTDDKNTDEDAGAEWKNKKLRSSAAPTGGAGDDSSIDDEVFNFRKLLKRRPDSPVMERRRKEERPNENFRSLLRSRPSGESGEKAPANKEDEEKPNFLGVLKKSSAQPAGGERVVADAEVPEWQRVKLRAREAGSAEPVAKKSESTDAEEKAPLFTLRKTGGKELIDEEERAAKARESELKAIERREARQKKENEDKANREAALKNRKLTLEEEVKELENKKDRLTKELAELEAKIAERGKQLKD